MVDEYRKAELAKMAREYITTQALPPHFACTKAHSGTIGACVYCERDALQADAERYRWLRANGFSAKFPQYSEEMSAWNDIADNMIDAAINKRGAEPCEP